MSNQNQPMQTPLMDLLRNVPEDARGEYEHHATSYSFIPYGRLCKESADRIATLEAENLKLKNMIDRGTGWADKERIWSLDSRDEPCVWSAYSGDKNYTQAACNPMPFQPHGSITYCFHCGHPVQIEDK